MDGLPDRDVALFSEADLAQRLGLSPRTLRKWRHERVDGPPFLRLPGGAVRYRPADVNTWIDDLERYRRTGEPLQTS